VRQILLIALTVVALGCGTSSGPSVAPAAPANTGAAPTTTATPEPTTARGLAITVEIPKRRWILGENILAHYVVKNVSEQPVAVSFGGDYRGSSRARRFIVVATDAEGNEVADPDAFSQLRAFIEHRGGSGMSGKPDAKEAKRLQARWSRFVREHAAALRKGKQFHIGDADLTKDLIPKGFVFHRPDAPDWP
jgi:hypothetical protein